MLPVTVLTGFLGAGKTTLLQRVLARARTERVGVIINEVGIAGTDAIAARERAYLELAEGCVCCTKNADLIAALEAFAARGDLDRVVIETTGVADPLGLTFTLERPDVAEHVRLDAVVTVVDALHAGEVAETPEWQAQVRAADLLVVSKTDVAAADAARALVAAANPVARLIDPADEEALAAALLDPDVAPRAREKGEASHSGFQACSFRGGVYDPDALEDLLETLPRAVFRAKGIARTPRGWLGFHAVAGRVQVDLDAPAPAHGESRLVFLGVGIATAALTERLQTCKIDV
jgi:G3E family GTPase